MSTIFENKLWLTTSTGGHMRKIPEIASLGCGLLRSCVAVPVLWLTLCGSAGATGFFINQQSVLGMGRVDAGNTAAADELGTIFFNPAGLIQFWKDSPGADFRSSFGVNLIIPQGEIRNTGSTAASPGTLGNFAPYTGGDAKNPVNPQPVPNVYVAKKLADGRAAIGAGINAPFGLATYSSADWFGRYDAIKARLTTVNLSLVGAYQVDSNLSIGGGIDAQYAETKLVNAIPNPLAPGGPSAATDGRAETIGRAWTPGFNAGLLYTFDSDTRVGLHYRSGMTHKIKGSTTIGGLTGPLTAFGGILGAHADVDLPAIATIGAWHKIDQLVLLAELEWDGWGSFKEVRIRFDGGQPDVVRPAHYRDAYAVAIGAEYSLPNSRVTARGGIHYDTTPTVDAYRDTTVPDSERVWLGLGTTYRWSDNVNLDFAFNHTFFNNASIGITRSFFNGTPLATAVRINGSAKTAVNTVSFNVRYAF